MFLSGAAVIVRQLLPSAAESRRPEEIGTRFFFGQLAGAFSNGWIDRDVVVYALNGELYRSRDVHLGGGTYLRGSVSGFLGSSASIGLRGGLFIISLPGFRLYLFFYLIDNSNSRNRAIHSFACSCE